MNAQPFDEASSCLHIRSPSYHQRHDPHASPEKLLE
jgi:hypothetical protein